MTSTTTTTAGTLGARGTTMLYGTAWKKNETTRLVATALAAGFRGIDTACQPKHYSEPLVGEAVRAFLQQQGADAAPPPPRESLYLQTKFTPLSGQDTSQPLPYDARADLPTQVRQSLATSLKNLGVEYLDALVLHSPLRTHADTMLVWRQMEDFVKTGVVKRIGISNIYDLERFKRIWAEAEVKPTVVQNRFYPDTGYDAALRDYLARLSPRPTYQSFWTLTANPQLLSHPHITRIVARLNSDPAALAAALGTAQAVVEPEHVLYRLVMDLGITPLNGTKNLERMKMDLAVARAKDLLTDEEVAVFRKLVG